MGSIKVVDVKNKKTTKKAQSSEYMLIIETPGTNQIWYFSPFTFKERKERKDVLDLICKNKGKTYAEVKWDAIKNLHTQRKASLEGVICMKFAEYLIQDYAENNFELTNRIDMKFSGNVKLTKQILATNILVSQMLKTVKTDPPNAAFDDSVLIDVTELSQEGIDSICEEITGDVYKSKAEEKKK